jgi:hypothetical protein
VAAADRPFSAALVVTLSADLQLAWTLWLFTHTVCTTADPAFGEARARLRAKLGRQSFNGLNCL